jgi:hypothetical protein
MKYLLIAILSFSFCVAEEVNLSDYESKTYSQNGEDGIIQEIFNRIGTTNKYYVEFGVEDGIECNTRLLREKGGWTGLMMDGVFQNEQTALFKEYITAENICHLFHKYGVPSAPDLLSVDIDCNDFHVWRASLKEFRPRVVVIEINGIIPPNEDKVYPYHPNNRWDGSFYYGSSALAIWKLARANGYSMVYIENRGVNCFLIRDDVLASCRDSFKNTNNVQALYKGREWGTIDLAPIRKELAKKRWMSFDQIERNPYKLKEWK